MQQIREQDTDWRKWLKTKSYRPFDPLPYFECRLYWDAKTESILDQSPAA